jgi:hypothetical protein
MFDFVQLNPTILLLGCPYKFLVQNTMIKESSYVNFHSSIDEKTLLMFIAINLQLMHYQIIVLQQ